jgi:aminoglycoside/choline kinase family phosphotransferase
MGLSDDLPNLLVVSSYPSDAEWLARAEMASGRRARAGAIGTIELMPRHASMRRYARVVVGGRSEVLMMMPTPESAPDEAGGGERPALSQDPFVLVHGWLNRLHQPVPELYAVDEDSDALWLEDVGTTDLDQWIVQEREPLADAYRRVLDTLLEFQQASQAERPPPVVSSRSFGPDILLWELEHYVKWRIEAALGATPTRAQRSALDRGFAALVGDLCAIPLVPMHRDFQSHNIMVKPEGELVLLDFQDAMLGPAVYDSVALLRDSYVRIPPGVLSELLRHYALGVVTTPAVAGASVDDVGLWFHMQTLQRKLKDAGRFVFIDRVKGNPDFLKYVDDSCSYVRDAFLAVGDRYPDLRDVLSELDPQVTP